MQVNTNHQLEIPESLREKLLQFRRRKYQRDEILLGDDVKHGRFFLQKTRPAKVVTLAADIHEHFFPAVVGQINPSETLLDNMQMLKGWGPLVDDILTAWEKGDFHP